MAVPPPGELLCLLAFTHAHRRTQTLTVCQLSHHMRTYTCTSTQTHVRTHAILHTDLMGSRPPPGHPHAQPPPFLGAAVPFSHTDALIIPCPFHAQISWALAPLPDTLTYLHHSLVLPPHLLGRCNKDKDHHPCMHSTPHLDTLITSPLQVCVLMLVCCELCECVIRR